MKIHNKYSAIHIGLFLIIALTAAGCTSEGKPAPETEEALLTVRTVAVKEAAAKYTLSLPGELTPFEEVMLYPKVTGFVQKIYVDRGSKVKKDQLLARLEAPEITQQYAAASAKQREIVERLRYSQQAYNRLQAAAKSTGAVAEIELEQTYSALMSDSATYQSLKAEMEAAKQLAAYLEIRAPFEGVITSRNVSQGALVGARDIPLFTLAEQDRLRLTIAIPEKHARALSDSTEIQYRLSNYPDEVFSARISRSSGVLDKKLRSLIVEFDVENKERKLSGGEYVQAEVQFKRAINSLWVPTASIVHASSGVFLLKAENGTIQRVSVKEGIRKEGNTEVFGDLQAKDRVVAKGSEELREGTKIKSTDLVVAK